MKTSLRVSSLKRAAAARLLVPVLVIGGMLIPAIASAQDAVKSHTLFMGADLSVGVDNQICAVRDVSGSSWVVDVNGRPTTVSAVSGPIDLRITPSLKLTEVSATITELSGTPAYSFGKDPSTTMTRALVKTAQDNVGYTAAVNQAQATVIQAQNLAQYTTATNNLHGPVLQPYSMGASNASAQVSRVENELEEAAGGPGADLELVGDRGLAQGCDALDVAFRISSEHRLDHPYVVIVTEFHRKDAGPARFQRLVFAKALNPIDSHPASVHFVEEGFPPAFEMRKFEVHLYNRGSEVATSVSPKRVELTRDEAFEYVKMEYISAHKADTLPATPAMGRLPASLPARLADGKYAGTFYVRVSKDGLAEAAFLDPACTTRADDPYLESVVKCIRFKPALERGQPTEGVAALNLGKLTI
ncbi:MAG: hypothetical protein ABSH26_04065 [Opitutaceae bacterium]|jgi:hypothetical protein